MTLRLIPWHSSVVKPESEWTEYDRDYIGFMRRAFEEGYKPRHDEAETMVEASSTAGRADRSACLVFRGRRNGWEPWLVDGEERVRLGPHYGLPEFTCVCVRPPFRSAAHFALEWLRGQSLESLLGEYEFVGGSPPGIEWIACSPTRSSENPVGTAGPISL